jgi:hypothetical protein
MQVQRIPTYIHGLPDGRYVAFFGLWWLAVAAIVYLLLGMSLAWTVIVCGGTAFNIGWWSPRSRLRQIFASRFAKHS